MKSSACKKIKSKFYYLSHCEIIKNKTDKKMTLVGKSCGCGGNSGSLVSSLNGEKIFLLLSLYLEAKFSQQQDFHILYSALPAACRTHFLPFRTEKKTMLPRFPSLLFQIGQKDKSQSQKTLENHTSYHIKSVVHMISLIRFFSGGVDYHPKTKFVTYNLEF